MNRYPPSDPAPPQATVPHQPAVPPQSTVPHQQAAHRQPVVQPQIGAPPQPYQNQRRTEVSVPRARARKQEPLSPRTRRLLLIALLGIPAALVTMMIVGLGMGALVVYGTGNVLPGVEVAGIDVGGKSKAEAANILAAQWNNEGIFLRDGERLWRINPAELGLAIDAQATAGAAYEWGRANGGVFGGIESVLGGVEIQPALVVDLLQAADGLDGVRDKLEQPAVNAGVRLVEGRAQAVPPVQGRALDIEATLAILQRDAASELADGALDLVMIPVAPAITDATPLVQEANALFSNTFTVEAYDPVTDGAVAWTITPQQWSSWLVASPSDTSPIGLSLALDDTSLGEFLAAREAELPAGNFLKHDESIQRINDALANRTFNTWLRVYHQPTTYTVQHGDSIASIGYDLGVPYPWIQAANPGLAGISPGQQINIPSLDDLIPLPVIRNKRIVISLSQQHLWAYENGNLVYDWVISTGIARSPTSPGVFQVQSHEGTAYASQWNLYMPSFMGVYQPGPGAGVMNGFHGFPTDANGGYLLWTNNLGRPATYGCILLSLQNGETLYNWAEEGVVVQINK